MIDNQSSQRPQPQDGPRRPVSAPQKPLPPGAWDCHAHVFGPFDKFPVIDERRYEPPLASAEDYLAMLDQVGFANGVVVHASAKGFNMANVADTLRRAPERLVGVAVTPNADELDALHQQGFRALRFTEAGRHAGRSPGTLYFDDLMRLAQKIRNLKWHAQIWGRCDLVMDRAKELSALDIPIVFDHLGYPDAQKGAKDPIWLSFVDWLKTGDYWVKTTPIRVGKLSDWSDAKPFYHSLLEAIPDRVIFGSDWPFLSLDNNLPNPATIINTLESWTRDETLWHKMMVDNPRSLYRRG
ncbi:MAG: metal-dependent hydrolase [Alphaproteobacteria bacterium]|nr:metal-dependent hydrolase [Alphaproteobacteria bacterium]